MIENGSSLQLENQWLRDTSADAYGAYLLISAWNLLEKKHDLKNALEKENFLDKNLWHIMSFCTRRSDGWPPISPVISKHAIFGVQSAWAAAYLADPVPSVHLKGGEPYKLQIQFTKSKTT